jgi:predicted ester cyclase
MSSATNVRPELVRAVAAFNDRADRLRFFEVFDPNIRLHGYPYGLDGLDGLRRFYLDLWTAFPDVGLELLQVISEGDQVAVRYSLSGTHKRRFLGIAPTHRNIGIEGLTMLRFSGALVVEEWHGPTELSILRAIGGIPGLAGPVVPAFAKHEGRRSASVEAAFLRWEEDEAE